MQQRRSLQKVLARKDVWAGNAASSRHRAVCSSQYPDLDKLLLGGGWPLGALTELHQQGWAVSGWHLLLPVLKQALAAQAGYVFLLNPPALPYAPGLQREGIVPNRVLALEVSAAGDWVAAWQELLASGCCLALFAWEPQRTLRQSDLRKLQLAASQSQSLCFLLRDSSRSISSSPAVLRVSLLPDADSLQVRIDRQRGTYQRGQVSIPWPPYLQLNRFDRRSSQVASRLQTESPQAKVLAFPGPL